MEQYEKTSSLIVLCFCKYATSLSWSIRDVSVYLRTIANCSEDKFIWITSHRNYNVKIMGNSSEILFVLTTSHTARGM